MQHLSLKGCCGGVEGWVFRWGPSCFHVVTGHMGYVSSVCVCYPSRWVTSPLSQCTPFTGGSENLPFKTWWSGGTTLVPVWWPRLHLYANEPPHRCEGGVALLTHPRYEQFDEAKDHERFIMKGSGYSWSKFRFIQNVFYIKLTFFQEHRWHSCTCKEANKYQNHMLSPWMLLKKNARFA